MTEGKIHKPGPAQANLAREMKPLYLNVFTVGRCYGGPEEGGWYYNSGVCIDSNRLSYREEWGPTMKAMMMSVMVDEAVEMHGHLAYGNIYSVNGGQEVSIEWDNKPGESFPKERPHYE